MKAFIVNRVGDFFFMLGLALTSCGSSRGGDLALLAVDRELDHALTHGLHLDQDRQRAVRRRGAPARNRRAGPPPERAEAGRCHPLSA